jgi:hypothetical protein
MRELPLCYGRERAAPVSKREVPGIPPQWWAPKSFPLDPRAHMLPPRGPSSAMLAHPDSLW